MHTPIERVRRKSWGDYYLGLFDGSLGETWFRWVEWLLVTAALNAAGNVTGAKILNVFAVISGGLTLFYAMGRIDELNAALTPRVRRLRPLMRAVFLLVAFVVSLVIVFAISNAVTAVFSDKLEP